MVLNEDHECSVCYERYSRSKHVPRILFCNHTFCSPCLETMATQRSGMLSISCPMCRQVSCMRPGLKLDEVLRVSHLWDKILPEEQCEKEKRRSIVAEAASPMQPQWPSSQDNHLILQFSRFLKRMIYPKRSQERIVPRCVNEIMVKTVRGGNALN